MIVEMSLDHKSFRMETGPGPPPDRGGGYRGRNLRNRNQVNRRRRPPPPQNENNGLNRGQGEPSFYNEGNNGHPFNPNAAPFYPRENTFPSRGRGRGQPKVNRGQPTYRGRGGNRKNGNNMRAGNQQNGNESVKERKKNTESPVIRFF